MSVPAIRSSEPGSGAAANAPRLAEPIAVIGCGVVVPGAATLAAFENLIYSSASAVGQAPADRWCPSDWLPSAENGRRTGDDPVAPCGGFVRDFKYDWRRHRISPKQIDKADPLLFMMLEAADAAWADAGYEKANYDRARTEVIVGMNSETDFLTTFLMGGRISHFVREVQNVCRRHGLGNDEQLDAVGREFSETLLRHMPALLDELGTYIPSGLAGRLAKIFDVMGGAVGIDSGDTSGVAAIAQAVASLRANANSLVVCVAGSRAITQQLYADRRVDPSTRSPRGAPPAEGAAVLLLKRLCDAERDGDPIRAIIHGVGTAYGASADTAFREAIRRAWGNVGRTRRRLSPAAVETVELSAAPDDVRAAELRALADFYGSDRKDSPILVGALDHQTGDTMAASGMAAAIKSCLQLERMSVPQLAAGDRGLNGAASGAGPLTAPRHPTSLQGSESGPPLAAVSCYDSLGSAYHVILERGTRVPLKSPASPSVSPLIATYQATNGAEESMAEVVLDPRKDRFLLEHQLRNRPLLPGIIAAESFAEVATQRMPGRHIAAIHDLEFVDGLRFLDDSCKTAKIYARVDGQNVHCRLTVDFRNRRGDLVKADRVYSTGIVELSDREPRLDLACPADCPTRGWYDLVYLDPGTMVYHGPIFQELRRIVFGESTIWGECTIRPLAELGGPRGGEGWLTRPATLDACLYLIGFASWKWNNRITGLPRRIGSVRFGRPPRPGESCYLRGHLVHADAEGMLFNITLFGDDREALIQGDAFRFQLIESAKHLSPTDPIP